MEQQAWIVRDILTRLEDGEASECIAGEFARLKTWSLKYRTEKTSSSAVAEKQQNMKKNRYKDIVPFDHSRVKLKLTTAKTDTDYINANFIQGVSGSKAYIATQGPLPHTVLDFLRMVWEFEMKVIVMACREFELGKKKCELYWPRSPGETFVCEPFKVYCDSEDEKGDYLTRTLRVTYRNSSRTLKQLHYVNWPDHGVPDSIPPILDMLDEMRSYQAHDDIPICIHCSAGCGRTGALCVIDYTWNLLKNQSITSDFSIYNLVQDMRTQRPSVVQTKEQYQLVYRTIKLLFQRFLDSLEQSQQNVVTDATPASAMRSESEMFDVSEQHAELVETKPEVADVEEPLPSPAVTEAVCLMVEDPYFDTPMSSPSSEETPQENSTAFTKPSLLLNDQNLDLDSDDVKVGGDEETAPPLPVRTPESYQLAVDAEVAGVCQRSAVTFPPEPGTEASKEPAGSPPSPIPPLPERTPESYELAEQVPAEQKPEAAPAVNLDVLGMSSEWFGNPTPAVVMRHDDKRRKSAKADLRLSVPIMQLNFKPHVAPHPAQNHLTPLLPDGNPRPSASCTAGVQARSSRVGVSSEWDGSCQSKSLMDVVMRRSKSVKAKDSKPEPLTVFQPITPLPLLTASEGSAAVESSNGNQHDPLLDADKWKKNDKGMTRTKSLKFFKKQKPKTSPPPPPSQPNAPPSHLAPSTGFKFGFGHRFGKPKGPRSYPDAWI